MLLLLSLLLSVRQTPRVFVCVQRVLVLFVLRYSKPHACVLAALCVSVLFAEVFEKQKPQHYARLSVLLLLLLCVRPQPLGDTEAVDTLVSERASVNEKGREQTERTKEIERKAHASALHQSVYAHANAKDAVIEQGHASQSQGQRCRQRLSRLCLRLCQLNSQSVRSLLAQHSAP